MCTYAAYEGITKQKTKHKACLAKEGSLLRERYPLVVLLRKALYLQRYPQVTTIKLLQFKPWHATHMMKKCVVLPTLRKKDPTWENEDIKQCFNVKHMVGLCLADQSQIVNSCLSLGGVAHKKRGWFPFENGHALVSHRAKALRGSEPTYKSKDYPWRISIVLRKGTWWIVEKARDMRNGGDKPCHLEEEAEVLVTLFLPEKASYKVESLSELSP